MSTQDPDDTWLDAASEPAEGPEGDHAGLRYEDRGRIAHGASGEVRRVFDHRLGCTVVMKVMWARLVDAVVLRDRFWREATTTARLQHPAIVPVHDRGELADGRPYFTMAEVRGDTYDVVVRHAQGRDIRRLVTLLARACEGVGYAHSLGVVHRDLKPANLMIGPFGEVLVMDWGIARDLNDAEDARVLELPGEEIYATRHGAILGTPAYMSPEQARAEHDLVDRRSDVFAVGAVLYRALTGRRHVHGTPQEVLEDLAQGRLSLFEHGGADVPDQLREITLNAMALDPDARFADAGEMAHALQDWLDGARRRERALAIVGSAAPIRAKATRLRRQADALRMQASSMLDQVSPRAPVADKAPAWSLQDAAKVRMRNARLAELEFEQRIRSALNEVATLPEAHEALADHYRERLEEAEARRDPVSVELEALLAAHDTGRHSAWLRGDGWLTLQSRPAAQAELLAVVEDKRRLVLKHDRMLGPTPLDVTLPRGTYVVRLRTPGHVVVDYPIRIDRGAHWDCVPPGRALPEAVWIPTRLGPNECYVPSGWFHAGGDPDAPEALPRMRWWVPGFVMSRHPVTNAEFLEFLHALVEAGEDPTPHVPAENADAAKPLYRWNGERFELGEDGQGQVWRPEWPVCVVSWHTAVRYAAWRAEETGQPWRLPHELEWEKAARSLDERHWPWGDHADLTRARLLHATPGPPSRGDVHEFPDDMSLYGVRGLGGNVRDWCATPYSRSGMVTAQTSPELWEPAEDSPYRIVRGGALASSARFARSAARFANRPEQRLWAVGFRLVRSVEAP